MSGVENLLRAKEWERSAIVYAFTTMPGKPGPAAADSGDSRYLTCKAFADLGIAGLRDGRR